MDTDGRTANPRYPSAIDLWLVLLVLMALGALIWQTVASFRNDPAAAFLSLSLAVLIAGAVGTFTYPCEYVLEPTRLVVRSGLARWRVGYADITTVAPSRSPWSAPALSLRRLRIGYTQGSRTGFVLVSPRDREGFEAALLARVAAARDVDDAATDPGSTGSIRWPKLGA
jgi:hypothetical protein